MSEYIIFKNIHKHISLSDVEKNCLLSSIKVLDVGRKELILKQGQLCKKIYFVEAGSLRAFNLNDDGRDSTIMFAIQDWWITDMNGFANQQNSLLSIEALELSTIIELDFKKLEELYQQIPKFERFFRILFQNAYIREQQRAFQNISLTTEERYRHFVNKYPAIVEKVTQKQIASYLGVTPEFLSSVKRNNNS